MSDLDLDPAQPARQTGVSVTRAEEELTVSTQWTATGRMRISKRRHTVTETRTFELIREELVIEELDADPATGGPHPQRPTAPPLTPLVLQREELVVTKRMVPYERVELAVDLITEQHTVTETLRKERVEADGDIAALTQNERRELPS